MTAVKIAARLLEADADSIDPQRYVDDYAQVPAFTQGSQQFVEDARKRYRELESSGVLEFMRRDWVKKHSRALDSDDIAEGIMALLPETRGYHGPLWVKAWLKKHASNHF